MPSQYLEAQEELLAAMRGGREERVRAILTGGACRVDAVDSEGRTPLHWACQYGHLPSVCLILSNYHTQALCAAPGTCSRCSLLQESTLAWPPQPRAVFRLQNDDSRSETDNHDDVITIGADNEISREAGEGSVCDVSLASDHGSIRESVEPTAPRLCTCIKEVAGRQQDGSAQQVLAGHLVNVRDAKGQTPLHVACNYRRAEVASFLASLSCCDVNIADRLGNTPLHRAIHGGLHTLACLLCDVGADVRAANSQLWTPLHEAIRCGSEDVIRRLLAKGCDVNAMTSSVAATTPFLTAIFYYKISLRSSDYGKGLDSILRLLIEAGCKLSEGDYQWTPLSASIDIDKSFIASLLLFNGCRFQRTLVSTSALSPRGAGKGCPGVYSRSLLVEAFTRCEPFVARLLVLCGYQPSPEEVEQCARRIPAFSPLFYRISRSEQAAMRGRTELLQWLRQRARTPNSLLELCRTALRLSLNHASGDTSILKPLQMLPLPTALRHYVSLSDFTHDALP